MAFRKKDETKKKIQEELAKKYPMQNPRTNVVAVVTKKEVPAVVQRIANSYTTAQQANSTAHKVQAQQVERIGKTALKATAGALNSQAEQSRQLGDMGARTVSRAGSGLTKAWNRQAGIQNQNSKQQVQQGQKRADAMAEHGKTILRQAGALAQQQVNANMTTEDTVLGVHKDFYASQNGRKTLYETSGVTGSDQTGASFYGYRNDTRYKEPNDTWSSGERKLHEFYSITNPKKAEAYAIRVNDRYNQRKKDEKTQAVCDWTSRSAAHGAAAWTGARGLNLGAGIDGINQQLELAARGVITVNPDLSASDIVETVDDTNAGNLSEKYGVGAGMAYQVGTDVADAVISRVVNGTTVAKTLGGDKIHDVNEAVKTFNESYIGAKKQGLSGGESVIFGATDAGANFLLGKATEKISEKFFRKEDVSRVFMEEPINTVVANIEIPGSKKWFEANESEIQERKGKYMREKNGYRRELHGGWQPRSFWKNH